MYNVKPMLEKIDPRKFELPGLEAEEQDISFFENLPYSDFRTWVPENSIYEETRSQIHALGRLNGIKALSFLSYVGPKPKDMYFTEFSHSRLDHTLTVALINEAILKQNGIPQDQMNLGIIAALLHDIATPAYGDATKQVDIKNLHEEDHWWNVLDSKGKKFIKQFGTKQMIGNIIKNQGVLGKVLDISDRITYTMKDMSGIQITLPPPDQQLNPYLAELNTIIANHPKIGNIYKEVGVDQKKHEVFFNNADALNVFLNLRAHLHQKLYLYPTNQARDLFIAKAISQIYSADGNSILSPNNLRSMSDYDLMQILADHYKGYASGMHLLLTNWNPEFERFNSVDKAKKKEEKLKSKDNVVVVGIKECRGFDSATKYKVTNGYKYVEFGELNPLAAGRIEKIAQSTKGVFLFWTDVSKNTPTNNLLKAVLKKNN
jgi:HD superfamily phosphohydrolase